MIKFDIIIFTVIFIIGLYLMIIPFIIEEKRVFEHGMVLRAQVKEKKKTHFIWYYKHDGNLYIYHSKRAGINKNREVNDWGALLVSKKDPSKVYKMMTNTEKIIVRSIGLMFMILPIIYIITTLR